VERLERDIKDKLEHIERLEKEKEACNLKIVEMQTRIDCKEQQHSAVIATMSMSQDMNNMRLKEAEYIYIHTRTYTHTHTQMCVYICIHYM
jgi:hypothetical protein